ncbi:MAG: hypothetical protein GX256_07990, partial [Fretibacterium sp.]|nr:hypothetical protein [Fretibacterium sp.]
MRRKFFNALGAAMALVMLLALSSAMAAEKTWTNGNGDGKWGTGANWNPAGAPGAGDIAVFNDNANITVSTSVADIAIRVLNDVEVALKSEGSGKLTLKGSDEPIKEEDIKGKASLLVAEGATLTTEADCLALPNAHAAIVLDGNLELGSNLEVPSGKVLHIKTENYRGALTGNVAGLVFTDSTSTIAFYGDVTLDGAKKIIDTVGGGAIEMAESWSILTATHKDTFVVNGPVIFKNSEGTCWSTLKLEAQLP